VTAATTHRENALARGALVSRHTAQWEHIQAALPKTRERLDEPAMSTRGTRRSWARSSPGTPSCTPSSPVCTPRPRGPATLVAQADALKILHILTRLPSAIGKSAPVATYHRESDALREFTRLRRFAPAPA
jgi:hypothetical protein